jgi:hypothetical protein
MSLQLLAELRRVGKRPPSVHLEIVNEVDRFAAQYPFSPWGPMHIQIPDSLHLSDVDWRVLHGLRVHIMGMYPEHADRVRKATKAAQSVDPAELTVLCPDGDSGAWTAHRRVLGAWLE